MLFEEVAVAGLPWSLSWRELGDAFVRRMRDTLLAHPEAVLIFATRPVRSGSAIENGNRMVSVLQAAGFAPEAALQMLRCLIEFTIGHMLGISPVRLGGRRRSRKPDPGSPSYNLLAQSADGAGVHDHFELGLAAMLDGFARHRSEA